MARHWCTVGRFLGSTVSSRFTRSFASSIGRIHGRPIDVGVTEPKLVSDFVSDNRLGIDLTRAGHPRRPSMIDPVVQNVTINELVPSIEREGHTDRLTATKLLGALIAVVDPLMGVDPIP